MLTQWKALTSEGVIADTPARAIQYSYALFPSQTFIDLVAVAISLFVAGTSGAFFPVTTTITRTIVQEWVIQIVRGDEDTVIFEERTHLEIQVVALVTAVSGIITLAQFTLWPIESKTTITVTVPDPPPRVVANPQGTLILQAPFDYTVWESISLGDWESPLYELNVAAGDRIKIAFHNAGGPYIPVLANVKTRVLGGGGISAVHSVKEGITFLLDSNDNGKCRLRRLAWHQLADVAAIQVRPDVEDAPITAGSLLPVNAGTKEKVLLTAGETVTVIQEDQGDIRYWESLNEGIYNTETSWKNMATLKGYRLLGATAAKDGGGVLLLLKDSDGNIVSSRARWDVGDDGKGTITFSTPVQVTLNGEPFPSIPDELHYLEDIGDSVLLGVRQGDNVKFYVSHDDIATFTDV